jgi:predicted transcriptional regulator
MSNIAGTPQIIKLVNKNNIERIIRTKGPITKPELAKLTELSLVTVNKTVEALLAEGRVEISGMNESTGGRCAQYFTANKNLCFYIILYYDELQYVGAVANAVGEIIYEAEFDVRVDEYDEVMEDTFRAIDALIKQCGGNKIEAIGIGIPGIFEDTKLVDIGKIPSWKDLDIAQIISDKYQIKVFIENDINLSTMGLYYSSFQKKVHSLALVFLDHNVGGGLIINGELYKGSTNFVGEMACIPVCAVNLESDKRELYKETLEDRILYLYERFNNAAMGERQELRSELINVISDVLTFIICIVNPEVIALECKLVDESGINEIRSILEERVVPKSIPQIINSNGMRKNGVAGLIALCIRESISVYALSSKKRD